MCTSNVCATLLDTTFWDTGEKKSHFLFMSYMSAHVTRKHTRTSTSSAWSAIDWESQRKSRSESKTEAVGIDGVYLRMIERHEWEESWRSRKNCLDGEGDKEMKQKTMFAYFRNLSNDFCTKRQRHKQGSERRRREKAKERKNKRIYFWSGKEVKKIRRKKKITTRTSSSPFWHTLPSTLWLFTNIC